jgi:predicted Holliday junction resolvase-like endonuclease
MPLPLRIFDYTERISDNPEKQTVKEDYISRNEFEKFKEEIKESIRQTRPNNFKKQNNKED